MTPQRPFAITNLAHATHVNQVRDAASAEGDASLLAKVAAGDLTALGELYDRHHRDVRRVLARAAQPTDVDDVLQATFLALPKVAASFDGRDSARAWLCGIAIRLESRRRRSAGRFFRALERFASSLSGPSGASSQAHQPEREAQASQELRFFEAALAGLDPKKRDVFVLFEVEGMPVEQIARLLAIPPATVRTRLFYARSALREAMADAMTAATKATGTRGGT